MVASAPSSSESAEDACLTKMSLFRGHNADGTRGDHSALVRRARATRGQVPHHPRGLARWSGYSATSRIDILQTSSLTSRLGEASTGAGLSRHDDIERTLLMLPIVVAMYRPGVCVVSHHRCASEGFGGHRREDLCISGLTEAREERRGASQIHPLLRGTHAHYGSAMSPSAMWHHPQSERNAYSRYSSSDTRARRVRVGAGASARRQRDARCVL